MSLPVRWAWVGLLGSVAAVLAPAPGFAQHMDAEVPGLPMELTGCGFCHGSHPEDGVGRGSMGMGGTAGSYALRLGSLPNLWGQDYPGATDPTPASRSCLRCHVSPDTRAQQPEFRAGGTLSLAQGKYLQRDLGDDHPLGRVDEGSGGLVDRTVWDPRVSGSTRFGNRLDPFQDHTLECTTCHDPHDRFGGAPGPEEQRSLCGRCHELASHVGAGHGGLACTDCHGVHGGSELSLLSDQDPDLVCTACHGATPGSPGRRGIEPLVLQAPRGHFEPQTGRCITCHDVHR